MVWNRVAQSYMRIFVSARINCMQPDRLGFLYKLSKAAIRADSQVPENLRSFVH